MSKNPLAISLPLFFLCLSAFAAQDAELDALPAVPSRLSSSAISRARALPESMNWVAHAHSLPNGRLAVKREGADAVLTLDAGLQSDLSHLLREYQPPYAAVVALEPSTGKVLALAEYAKANPQLHGLYTQAVFPAASVFKLVTATALLKEGLSPEQGECFHGGKRRISEKLLVDSRRDGHCYPLSLALAKSANVVFAKMTLKHLTAEKLEAAATALGFNRRLPFPIPTDISLASIPREPLGLATAGAGFGDVYLSPLHGAVMAAAIANGGKWKDPVLFERDIASTKTDEQVISPRVAEELTEMMARTVTEGTARRIFRERGYRVLGAVGKTGSLADRKPFRDYSWFVGFAPRENPQIAVAAVVVNDSRWRIRATWLAREAMRHYLNSRTFQGPSLEPIFSRRAH